MDELMEKVIKGLECCTTPNEGLDMCKINECPYRKSDSPKGTCEFYLMDDALTILKEQEPRVMTQEEVKQYLFINENGLLNEEQWKELHQKAPIYLEFRESYDYQQNWRTTEQLRPWAMESMFWENYNKKRRCWTAKPTDVQREAVKWE